MSFWMATKRIDESTVWFDRALALAGGEDAHRGRAASEGMSRALFSVLESAAEIVSSRRCRWLM